jgi:GNAT superfamily N-acetyltransferase
VVTIRRIQAGDLDALYRVSVATGALGENASPLYADPKIVGHIYMAPYVLLAPERALLAEDDEGVAGFIVGTTDTPAWEARLEKEWWPALRSQYPAPEIRHEEFWTPDERRASTIHNPVPTPTGVTKSFPAHVHMNLLPRIRRKGLGSKLLSQWQLESGATTVHVGVNRANLGAIAFWTRRGFSELPVEDTVPGRTIWLGNAD